MYTHPGKYANYLLMKVVKSSVVLLFMAHKRRQKLYLDLRFTSQSFHHEK